MAQLRGRRLTARRAEEHQAGEVHPARLQAIRERRFQRLDILASYFAKTPAEDQNDMPSSARERAVQLLSELVGAIILARAVAQANQSLSDEILEAVSTGFQTQMKQTTTMNE